MAKRLQRRRSREIVVRPSPIREATGSPTKAFVMGAVAIKAMGAGIVPALYRALAAPEEKDEAPDVPWNRLLTKALYWMGVLLIIAGTVAVVEGFDRSAAWTYSMVLLLLLVLNDWATIYAFLLDVGVIGKGQASA